MNAAIYTASVETYKEQELVAAVDANYAAGRKRLERQYAGQPRQPDTFMRRYKFDSSTS